MGTLETEQCLFMVVNSCCSTGIIGPGNQRLDAKIDKLHINDDVSGVDEGTSELNPSNLPRCGKVSKRTAQQYNMLELEYGRGVYLYESQVMKAAGRFSGTACATFLLNCFYTNDELLGTNLTGANNKKALDADILSSILSFTLTYFNDADEVGLKKALRNKITSFECKHKRKLLEDSHNEFVNRSSQHGLNDQTSSSIQYA